MTRGSSAVAEPENAWAGQGAVLLDIGGDIGALVVAMPAAMVGREIEVRSLDDPGHHGGHPRHHGHQHLAHVAVVARPIQGGHLSSSVFPNLRAGRYELFEKGRGGEVALSVEVAGGEVVTASWPGAA